jgi:hypothetical protein
VLKNALKDLQTFEPAVSSFASPTPQTPIRTEPSNWCFEKIKEYLVPIVLMGWGLITQSGLLSADTVKAIPVIGALISIALKIKENYQNFMREAKTEDIRKLIEIRNALVEIFMNVHDIDNTFQGRVQTELMKKTHQSVIDNAFQARAQTDLMRETHQSIIDNASQGRVQTEALKNLEKNIGNLSVDQSSRIEKLEEEISQLKAGVNILIAWTQKQSTTQHVTDHRTTGHPA